MVAKILAFFAALPRELYIFVISMLPIIELRGAVPVGAYLGVPFYLNYILAVVGNMLPVPFILLFIPKFLTFLDRFKFFQPMVRWLRGKADKHSGKVLKDSNGGGSIRRARHVRCIANSHDGCLDRLAYRIALWSAVQKIAFGSLYRRTYMRSYYDARILRRYRIPFISCINEKCRICQKSRQILHFFI